MADLKADHLYLYHRVRLKVIFLVFLGTSLILFPGKTPSLANAPIAKYVFDQRVLGLVFINLGVLMAVGMYRKRKNYRLARTALRVSAYYSLLWALCLIYICVKTPSAIPITGFFLYFMTNLFVVSSDAGWKAIEYIDEYKEREGTS